MKIEILGTGCPNCRRLEANARKALEESGKNAEIVKVTDVEEIMSYGVMSLPEAIILRKVIKPKLLAVYFGIVALGIIFTGYLFKMMM